MWEYTTFYADSAELDEILNEHRQRNWELVGVTPHAWVAGAATYSAESAAADARPVVTLYCVAMKRERPL